MLSRRSAGVITVFSGPTDEQRARLAAREIPLVVLDPAGDPGRAVPSVGATNWSGGLEATRHLLELGHRRIAMITGPDWALASRARLDGYRAALDAAGVPVDPALICPRHLPDRGRPHPDPPADEPARAAHRDLRLQRRPGRRRLPRGPRPAAAHPGRPQRDRLRRHARLALGHAAADHDPAAADGDGRHGGHHADLLAEGETLAQRRVELGTELIVRKSTAAPNRRRTVSADHGSPKPKLRWITLDFFVMRE